MNKEQFFANELIISFLHDFQKGLMNLPTSAREQHVLEIKSDLYENALSKESEGIPSGVIPSQVIAEFLPPKELAKEIAVEYTDVIEKHSNLRIHLLNTLQDFQLLHLALYQYRLYLVLSTFQLACHFTSLYREQHLVYL